MLVTTCLPSTSVVVEPYDTITYEGLTINRYEHVDGWGPGGTLYGWMADPWNSSANELCQLNPSPEDALEYACPSACQQSSQRVAKKRVRRSIGKMSDEEWQKVPSRVPGAR